ncbi:hypothetical protein WJX73_008506 [Symbiochloris irregularis]|uniref:Uncharacterized protein n=1 Tax=Symbiochloris irregularis TaxID=706552 RepID=A0AAW1NP13_9CHLO
MIQDTAEPDSSRTTDEASPLSSTPYVNGTPQEALQPPADLCTQLLRPARQDYSKPLPFIFGSPEYLQDPACGLASGSDSTTAPLVQPSADEHQGRQSDVSQGAQGNAEAEHAPPDEEATSTAVRAGSASQDDLARLLDEDDSSLFGVNELPES